MGRLNHERHIHYRYSPLVQEYWSYQTEEFKQICDDVGKEYGYTGINIFYIVTIIKAIQSVGYTIEAFKKKY